MHSSENDNAEQRKLIILRNQAVGDGLQSESIVTINVKLILLRSSWYHHLSKPLVFSIPVLYERPCLYNLGGIDELLEVDSPWDRNQGGLQIL